MLIKKFKKNLSVIVLCGGEGKRLYPLTKKIPKPLIKIKKKTILNYILNHLIEYKVEDIILATGYKHKSFLKFHSTVKNKNKIRVLYTGKNIDIVKRILKCKKFCRENVLICYGDTIVDINLNSLISFYLKNKNKITLSSYKLKSQFGLMKIGNNGNLRSFSEKPDLGLYFNIGYFLLKRDTLDILANFKSFKSFLESKISKKILRCFIHKGNHITVNTISELNSAKQKLNEK